MVIYYCHCHCQCKRTAAHCLVQHPHRNLFESNFPDRRFVDCNREIIPDIVNRFQSKCYRSGRWNNERKEDRRVGGGGVKAEKGEGGFQQ